MSFADVWSKADEASDPPEPGMYDVVLSGTRAFVSKEKQEAWVSLSWTVTSKRNRDHSWDVLLGFRSSGQAKVAKGEIRKLGVDVEAITDIDDLDTALKRVAGNFYCVEVKQNGEFRNTYVIENAAPVQPDIPGVPAAEPVAAGYTDDDDVPF